MGFCFCPLIFFKLKSFMTLLAVSLIFTVVLYTFFSSYISSGFNIGNFIISSLIIIWALRLGSFLFLRICKEGEDKRFKFIKPSATRFFMTWTLQGMWVSICSLSALTAMSSPTGVVVNGMLFIGISIFIFGLLLEIIADYQKHNLETSQKMRGILSVLVYGRIQDIQIMLVKLCYGQVFL